MLMLLTAIVGMLLASSAAIPWSILICATAGIGLAASSGAVLNHLVDRQIDGRMRRTERRPVATGRISPTQAVIFAAVLGVSGMAILIAWVNMLTALLTLAALIGYALIYTVFLKRATPQNIVIGGLAGAMPPLLGWTAVTGVMDYTSWLLVLIIFAWTPPHFWSLAIYRYEDYLKADVPMLTVTHGIPYTKLHILLYTLILTAITMLPFVVDMSGLIYLVGVSILDLGFIYWVIRLLRSNDRKIALHTFQYSIIYLMSLFLVLLIDHYVPILT